MAYKLTLREVQALIRQAIVKHSEKHIVENGFGAADSWRGNYAEIAFEPAAYVSLESMLQHALDVEGQILSGYKGGDYYMDANTDCNIAHHGQYNDTADHLTESRLLAMLDISHKNIQDMKKTSYTIRVYNGNESWEHKNTHGDVIEFDTHTEAKAKVKKLFETASIKAAAIVRIEKFIVEYMNNIDKQLEKTKKEIEKTLATLSEDQRKKLLTELTNKL